LDEIETLVEPLIPALRRYAFALVRADDAADDLVQDCLERAVSRWSLRRRDGDVAAWLFAILRNRHISLYRQRRRRGGDVALETVEGALHSSPTQDHDLVLRDVLEALDALPEEQKSLLLLVGVEDLSYEQAARVMGIPVGTVMSRLSRGRARLRALLETGRAPLLRRVK
jgi:RNA polymerase sigma-70 factor (ECF subfamily)